MKSLINKESLTNNLYRSHFEFHWSLMFCACVSKYYCVFVALLVNSYNISADSTLNNFLL